MMTRNTERRVELFAPVTDAKIRKKISDALDISLKDNVKAREMYADGQYRRAAAIGAESGADGAGKPLDSQNYFIAEAVKNATEEIEITTVEQKNFVDTIKKIISKIFAKPNKINL
jgi:polyphosphate kinase